MQPAAVLSWSSLPALHLEVKSVSGSASSSPLNWRWQDSSPRAVTAVGPEVVFPRELAKHSSLLRSLTMGTITSATAQHSADERKRTSEGFFFPWRPQISGRLHGSSPLSLSFPHLPFSRLASRLRNVIWFWNATLCHTLGSAAHALRSSLDSVRAPLKCGSIHLERMLRLVLKVERMLPNEPRHRPSPRQHNLLMVTDFKLLLIVLALRRRVSRIPRTQPALPLQITYQAKRTAYPELPSFEMSHQCVMHYSDAGASFPRRWGNIFSLCAFVSLSAGLWGICTNPWTKERRTPQIWMNVESLLFF